MVSAGVLQLWALAGLAAVLVADRPEKPKNLSCIAVQEGTQISPSISCQWEAVGPQTEAVPTNYTLFVKKRTNDKIYSASKRGPTNSIQVDLEVFPHFDSLDIWVVAQNDLGKEESEHLIKYAQYFVKTNPPSDVEVISEAAFPTSLVVNWSHPIIKVYVDLIYQIRFRQLRSHIWTYVPLEDTSRYIESFRLQDLQPYTDYVTQVRCKCSVKDYGYWSDWSKNAIKRTPEDKPKSKPDLWKITTEGGINKRQIEFICKDPELSNGIIRRFNITIQIKKDKSKNGSWESIQVNRSVPDFNRIQEEVTRLKKIDLADEQSVYVIVTAINSVGASPWKVLIFDPKRNEPPVEKMEVRSHKGQLWLEWKPPNRTVSEYVVEWVSGGEIDWQRENGNSNGTVIKGDIKPFVCYNVSVYPIYSGRIGKPVHQQAYVEQGAPLQGPTVNLSGDPGRNSAVLVWEEIPLTARRGFITNYTIHWKNATGICVKTVPANTTSYTLTSLSHNTKYDIWINVSTVAGSYKGPNHSFTTLKYAPGEIEAIVVGASLGFLFIVLMTMLLCFYKKDVIKENFWPQIPNPGESTIGNWSPDYPLKAEAPRENCLSGISVLNVDMCDAKCVFDEDKASLPLKKDKYLSEEHSSGIGGSSCMSSPRQSVSDSDEGGDMADTTASTIQYSSVVAASSGYKGQNPSSLPQQSIFSRSESTQPLLDCEENQDTLVQETSRQCFQRQPCFTPNVGNESTTNGDGFNPLEMEQQEVLDFCPLEEDTEQTAPTECQSDEWISAPVSSYMPQLGGYRPQ
ncbi:interleukin-6 receptor subunit beta isoform X2 [Archocentrus centrarchus]|uniref:interleukin-6 receptor subunit beta isoform X2 n=1 Tax=Archocentrus centrarchus TaxID=63155 RepID=UPI0011E9D49D|nr:interleukin-6 receptor subunit beta isoform X2 [Archocentrus centrarchus]